MNLVNDPRYRDAAKELRAALQAHLVETDDPRETGGDVLWDYYPYYGVRRNKDWRVDPRPE